MRVCWMIARAEVRQRWASLLTLVALVALVSAVVIASLVGAQRTSSTVERFRDRAMSIDVEYQADVPERGDVMLAAAKDSSAVAVATRRVLVNVFPTDGSAPDLAILSDPDDVYGKGLEVPLVLEGRMPDRDAPDEILLNELAARVTGLRIGDRLEVNTWSPDDLEALFSGPDFPGFNGPRLTLQIVGIGRTASELTGDVRRTAPFAIGSPSFTTAHPDIGTWPAVVVVRTTAGPEVVDDVTSHIADAALEVDGLPDTGGTTLDATTAGDAYLDTSQMTVNTLAAGLIAFAAASAFAGALAVGQAMRRQLAGSAARTTTLRSLGLTRSEIALAQTVPVAAAGALGTLFGAGMAVAASGLLPRGLAQRAEVDPGVWLAPGTTLVSAAAIWVLLVGSTFLIARRRIDRVGGSPDRRPSAAAQLAARLGARPGTTIGIRLATDRGRGRGVDVVPVRSALIGIAVAVAGTIGAGVVAASFHELETTPGRWGWSWSSMPDYFGDGDITELGATLVEDGRLDAVADLVVDRVVIDGQGISAFALEPLKGSVGFTTLEGRAPAGPGEIAMGRATMEQLDIRTGDTVEVTRRDGGSTELVVVGSVVLPPTEEYDLDLGVVLTPDGLDAMGIGDVLGSLVLRYPPDADRAALEAALTADYGFDFNLFTQPNPPGSIRNLVESRNIALALAAYFVALGATGLFHTLLVSTRRRRDDLAVLRSLGFTTAQVRGSITIAAVVLAVAGSIIGIALGLACGRLLWRALADTSGAVADPSIPWWIVVAAVPLTAAVAAAMSWWPGRGAVRAQPASLLRTE